MKNFNNIQKVISFGCKLNIYESEIIKKHLYSLKLKNIIVINTCAVTSEAERQSKQTIRKMRKENPKTRIIVTGCSAQLNPQLYEAMPEIDQILGNVEKMIKTNFVSKQIKTQNIDYVKNTKHFSNTMLKNKPKVFLEIQNGCNYKCTFCIIPTSRGNNRSVLTNIIIQQIKNIINKCKEVVFTGVDITDYGQDFLHKSNLGELSTKILINIHQLYRLRISSLDPIKIDQNLLKLIIINFRIMPHIHLSIQSGDNIILKRMKRRHLSKDIIDICNYINCLRPDIIFGADIISGFPTETENMFQNTIKIIKKCNIIHLHIFPYSPRYKTPAAIMPQVYKKIIKERSKNLRILAKQQLKNFLLSHINKKTSVLIEKNYYGYCKYYLKTYFKEEKNTQNNQIKNGKILFYNSKINLLATIK